MPAGDILEARIVGALNDQGSINVLHYRIANSTTPEPTNADAALALDTLFAPFYKQAMSLQSAYHGVGVKRIFPLPATVEGVATPNLGPGLIAGDALPSQTCGLITKRTQFAGRAFRGRLYVPFPGEDASDLQGLPNILYTTALVSINSALVVNVAVTSGGGGSWNLQPILFHRATNTFDVLIPGTPRGKWATQRRRGSFGRPNPAPF